MIRFASAATVAALMASGAMAQTAMPFTLDWQFEGPAGPYLLAQERGYFKERGLDVEIMAGAGSLDAIPKVATGAFPVGFTDMNSLVRFIDQNPTAPLTAIMVVYNKPPVAVVGRKSLGIHEPKDLEGRVLGAPPPDGAWAQFPIFAAEAGLDMSKITVEPLGFPVREPSLAQGQVAAVTGFSFTSSLSTIRLGVPEDDITILMMSDYGLALYGNAILVNTDFAKANPDAVKGFLEAVALGWKDALADPDAAIAALLKANPAADVALETRRLAMSLSDNVNTDEVKANGFGPVDPARFAKMLEQTAMVYTFVNTPDPARYFDPSYLPEGGFRLE